MKKKGCKTKMKCGGKVHKMKSGGKLKVRGKGAATKGCYLKRNG